MRNHYLNLCFVLILFSCNSPESKGPDGTTFKDAVAYNDFIIKHQGKIINHILSVSALIGEDLDSAEALLGKGVLITDSALAQVKAMGDFKGDTIFRNRAVANFQFYRKLFTSDYRKIVSINKKGEAATEADVEMLQSIQSNLEEEEAELDKRLSNAQSDFAKKNKMPLLDNDVQKKIDSTE